MTASKHHPHLRRARRTVWCACECGWTSGYYRTVTGAHLAFGAHLLENATAAAPPVPTATTTVTTAPSTEPSPTGLPVVDPIETEETP